MYTIEFPPSTATAADESMTVMLKMRELDAKAPLKTMGVCETAPRRLHWDWSKMRS